MLLLIALSAALAGDRHRNPPTIELPADQPRAGWSQPMQPMPAPQDPPPLDLPQGAGPRATSGGPLFDTVAVAQPDDGAPGVSVSVAGLSPGGFVELTELGAGHTILATVNSNQAPGGAVLLSQGAFQVLGIGPGAGMRVRLATPTPQDQNALHAGNAASSRIDAPEVLLKALRKRIPQYAARSPARPARPRAIDPDFNAPLGPPRPVTRGPRHADEGAPRADYNAPAPIVRSQPRATERRSGYVVQVAALSAADRATELARSLGGRVTSGAGLYRVQLGPFNDATSANRARDEAIRHGYRDAHVFHE